MIGKGNVSDSDFKVDFFCVGVAKAGTTTLHDLLSQQASLCLPKRKETNYFSFGMAGRPSFTGPLDNSSVNDPTITSLDEYVADFDYQQGALCGEICPSYVLDGAAENIYAHNPDAKIIILLREPVSRAYSNYQHLVRDGREHNSFEEALAGEAERLEQGWEWFWGLKSNSLYAGFVQKYLEKFGQENVRIIFFEDFVKNQAQYLRQVMAFVGLDPDSAVLDEQLSSNSSGVVSGKWRFLHRMLLSEGKLNSALRTLLPDSARKKLGALFKRFSTVKGEVSEETRELLLREFSTDLAQLNTLVEGRVSDWVRQSSVS